jgi:hypothetical protein
LRCFASGLPRNCSIAEPKPHQPGSATRHWPQLKPQGMARRSSIARVALREAGREPMFSSAISRIGVALKKYVGEARRLVDQLAVGGHSSHR